MLPARPYAISVTHIVLGLLLIGAINVGLAHDVEPFDLKNPLLPEPGKKYRLVIEPCGNLPPGNLLFVAAEDAADPTPESGGKPWTGISHIEADWEEVPVSTEAGVVHVGVEDYDGDGCLDVRIPSTWGTGGTWYTYLRFDGSRYVDGRSRRSSESTESMSLRRRRVHPRGRRLRTTLAALL